MDGKDGPRTVIATLSRVDRAARKALRAKERKTRETAKRNTSPEMAARYEVLFEQLTRTHCVKYERLDWREIAESGLVEPAIKANALEQKARRALANYNPGVIDSMFGLGADRRRALAEKVLEAAKKDAELYARAKRNAEVHNLDVTLALDVMALDFTAIESALKAHIPADELKPVLEGMAVDMPAPGKLVVHIDVLELDAIPDEAVGLGENGRAVYDLIPPGMRNEIHLTNVCSAVLRVGVETMSVVPIEAIDILARCFMPGGKVKGDMVHQPILHLRLPYQALKAMDLRKMEPVSAVTALGGRIDWEIGRGFSPIGIDDLKLVAPPPPPPRLAAPA